MKRLVLRIAALGTVVLLGLFAIAQAQRGSKDSLSAAGELAPAGKAASAEGKLNPIVAPSSPGNRLRGRVSAGSDENPLRGEGGLAAPTEVVPPPNVLAADYRANPAAADPAPAGQPMQRPSADPFGLHAGRSAAATSRALGQVVQTASEIPAASGPEMMSPGGVPVEGTRYPQPSSPLAPAEPYIGTPVAPSGAGPSIPDRYAELRPESSEAQEPAPFKADPFATPARGYRPDPIAPSYFPQPVAEAASVGAAPVGEGSGRPGRKQLEGPQHPQLTIQKFAPQAVQVGKAATFRVTVRNTGSVAAHGVEVRDQVPKGSRLIGTTPRASRGARGELVWTLGTLEPGDEASVEIQLEPIEEGEIGSVATVRFNADASARSIATKPELVVETSAPPQVLIGEQIRLTIEVSNPGSGVATGVVLEEHVPSALEHPAGGNLEYEVGDLPPGESRKLELTLLASRPGPVANVLIARADGGLRAEDQLDLEVIAPLLDVSIAGPKRRFLEREATYRLSVHNPGTAPAELVELVAYLPSGLQFVSANNNGHYEEVDRTVHWQLEELPTDMPGTVELVTMPVKAGQQKLRLRGTAERVSPVEREQPVLVEGIAAIMFEVVDVTDPIEVGGQTTYEVRVLNQGTKAAANVRLALLLPPEMRAVAAEGPTRHVLDGGQIIFEGLSRLAPKADTTYRVRAEGLKPGDLRTRVYLQTDEMNTPVTKEESTRVYSDE